MKKKVLGALICAAVVGMGISAYAEEAKTIAYINPSTTTPFWNWVEDGIRAQCEADGYELVVYDSANDSATQLKNGQNAITAGVDAIIISPTDSASCPAVLEEAESADIPVVICDIGSDEGTYLTLVATPNYEGAKEVGEYLGQYLKDNGKEGSIGQITIPLARINGQLRTQGFADGLAEFGYEVGTTLETSDFTVDEADGQTRNIATANDDLIAIFANHDQATLGAVAALEDLGLLEDVAVVSFDGNPDIMEELKNGQILACGAQQPKKMGKESVNALTAFWAGEDVPEQIDVPTIFLTADNVEEHLQEIDEDVCGLGE